MLRDRVSTRRVHQRGRTLLQDARRLRVHLSADGDERALHHPRAGRIERAIPLDGRHARRPGAHPGGDDLAVAIPVHDVIPAGIPGDLRVRAELLRGGDAVRGPPLLRRLVEQLRLAGLLARLERPRPPLPAAPRLLRLARRALLQGRCHRLYFLCLRAGSRVAHGLHHEEAERIWFLCYDVADANCRGAAVEVG